MRPWADAGGGRPTSATNYSAVLSTHCSDAGRGQRSTTHICEFSSLLTFVDMLLGFEPRRRVLQDIEFGCMSTQTPAQRRLPRIMGRAANGAKLRKISREPKMAPKALDTDCQRSSRRKLNPCLDSLIDRRFVSAISLLDQRRPSGRFSTRSAIPLVRARGAGDTRLQGFARPLWINQRSRHLRSLGALRNSAGLWLENDRRCRDWCRKLRIITLLMLSLCCVR